MLLSAVPGPHQRIRATVAKGDAEPTRCRLIVAAAFRRKGPKKLKIRTLETLCSSWQKGAAPNAPKKIQSFICNG